jgi:hypothetical protein
MNTTRQRTTLLAVVLLAGAVGLGGCGDDSDGSQPPPQAAAAEPAQQAPHTLDADSCHLPAMTLRALRGIHPTAGLEVPPASLRARVPDQSPGQPSRTGQQNDVTEPVDRFSRHVE